MWGATGSECKDVEELFMVVWMEWTASINGLGNCQSNSLNYYTYKELLVRVRHQSIPVTFMYVVVVAAKCNVVTTIVVLLYVAPTPSSGWYPCLTLS